MTDRAEKREALEEAVRLLEFVRAGQSPDGEMDFDEARIDGYVATALSAARAALSATAEREEGNR